VGGWKGGGVGGDEGSLSQWPNTRDRKVEIASYGDVSTRGEPSSCGRVQLSTRWTFDI
jgi:hypothetical protein